jgi:hypothetical protein
MSSDGTDLMALEACRYLNERGHLPRIGNLGLAFQYEAAGDAERFQQMLRVPPDVFHILLRLIEDHPIFHNQSNNEQTPVSFQLAVTLYRMGRYGNGVSWDDIARIAGIAKGSVPNFTRRVITAINSLHPRLMRLPSAEEKEVEKRWIEERVGFRGLWREGWLMYDGTTVVLPREPHFFGDAYYSHNAEYGFSLQVWHAPSLVPSLTHPQVGCTPSNLRIVDYSHGHTASAHDALAFEHTAAFQNPQWLFVEEEFCWCDSAYPISSTCIPIYRRPASELPVNRIFDTQVSCLHIRAEHCMAALKNRFQCMRGLPLVIRGADEHVEAMAWITACILLHNLIVDVSSVDDIHFRFNDAVEPVRHNWQPMDHGEEVQRQGEEKRQRLVAELLDFRAQ